MDALSKAVTECNANIINTHSYNKNVVNSYDRNLALFHLDFRLFNAQCLLILIISCRGVVFIVV